MKTGFKIRIATINDLDAILNIYNQGIADRLATLEEDQKDIGYINDWFNNHKVRFAVTVIENEYEIVGFLL